MTNSTHTNIEVRESDLTASDIKELIESCLKSARCLGDDDLIAKCQAALVCELYESETAELVQPSEYPSIVEYVSDICDSLDCAQAEGHILSDHIGRRVYAV